MNTNYSDIYFAITSISTIIIAGVLLLCLCYVLSILQDIKRVSQIAKKEVEIIARGLQAGATMLGSELSAEAQGFVRTIFALLLSQFAKKTRAKKK